MTIKTIQAPALVNESAHDFAQSLQKNIDIAEIIRSLIANQGTKHQWESMAGALAWETLNHATVRSIALDVYTLPYGYLILKKILPLNILRFEDFIKMSENWENHDFFLTEAVIFKCQEVAKYCNRSIFGRKISARIANSGYPSWYAVRHYSFG